MMLFWALAAVLAHHNGTFFFFFLGSAWSLSFILSYYCGYNSYCSLESNYIEKILKSILKTLNEESLPIAPAGSESNVHREESLTITPNIVDASLHQKTTKANKCACSTCSICGIILCILGLCIFIVLVKTVLTSLVNM